jgi:hypothetical protein
MEEIAGRQGMLMKLMTRDESLFREFVVIRYEFEYKIGITPQVLG